MASPSTDRRLGLVGNTAYKAAATVVATANITLSGEQTIDGIAVVESNATGRPDRVLCIGQNDGSDNGLWDVSTGAWVRSKDANGNYDLANGSQVIIARGSRAYSVYVLATSDPITIGTTDQSWQQALTTSFLATLAATGGASLIGYSPDSGGTTGVQAATVAINLNARTRSVLDFIPDSEHAAIRARTSTANLTTYFQNAAVAVNRDTVAGAGPGGMVLVPAGRYRINNVGCRDTVFRGEHGGGTLIQAHTAGTGHLMDCALDRDGTTANTDGGRGGFISMKLDGRSLGYSGLQTYGGFSPLSDLVVTGFVIGVSMGLPIEMLVQRVYSMLNSSKGFHTYSGAGDLGTSLTMIGCWGDGNTTNNFHIEQLSYSTFIACASQAVGAAGIGWYLEGSTNGAGVGSSLHLIGCASEGDLGNPFYLKNQRGLVIDSPKVVSPPASKNIITLDDASGVLQSFQSPTPGVGFYGVEVMNQTDSNGAVIAVGGDFTIDPTKMSLFSSVGAQINTNRRSHVAGALRGYSITPAGLATSQNDFSVPAGVGELRLTPAVGASSITGFAMSGGNVDGAEIVIHNLNTSTDNITLVHASVSSSASNRINLPGLANVVIPPLGSAVLKYDGTASRFKCISKST